MNFAQQAARIVWRKSHLDSDESMFGMLMEDFAQYLEKILEPIKVTIHTCIIDCADGSYYPAAFKTLDGAERREKYELDVCGYVPCEAVSSIQVEVDAAGNVVGGTDYTHTENDEEVYEP